MKRHELVNLAIFITLAGVMLFRVGSLWPDVPDAGAVWRRIGLGLCAAMIIPASGWVSQNFQRPSAGFLGRVYLAFVLLSIIIDAVTARYFEMIMGILWLPIFFGVIYLLRINRWIDTVTRSPSRAVAIEKATRAVSSGARSVPGRLPARLNRHETVNVIVGVVLSITAAFMTITRWLEADYGDETSLAAQWQSWVLAGCFVVITVIAAWGASNYGRPTVDYVTIVYGTLGAVAVIGYLVTERFTNALTIAIATPLLLIILRLPTVRGWLEASVSDTTLNPTLGSSYRPPNHVPADGADNRPSGGH
ncbi:hypothetical protein ONR57_07695 [Hoyosella sp. YIM 151337]|uniref:hypothetical protein n=1 Tax=Hoyosella sp. YIM 151337 TaxID=2992742 RepID=UPI002235B887|nr:hypothetical protein [Hoyosella sp. YIM 151337]MCW4353179.1 hypothetical protein [Hoyosella sp. YIM 151337]